jgi:PAS domain S-box-containing protein
MKQFKGEDSHMKDVGSKRYEKATLFSCIFVIILGMAVLLYSVLLESNILSPEKTGHLPMAKDAALCFVFCGLALLGAKGTGKPARMLSKIFALLTVASSLLSIAQRNFPKLYEVLYIFGDHVNFGMALQTALAFLFTGMAVWFISVKKVVIVAQFLLHSVTLISGVVIFGHILKIPQFYHFTIFDAMSIYTAVGLIIFTVAASLFNPTAGITGIYTGNKIGNIMARRLSPGILVVLFLITYLRIAAHRHEWVTSELGMALFALAFLITTLVLIFATSSALNEIGDKKEIAKYNFEALVKSAPNALVMSDTEGNIAFVNEEATKIFGYGPNELEGNSLDIVVPERFRAAHREKQPNYIHSPQPRHFNALNDLYALRKDGSEFPIEIGITPIKTEKGFVALASIIDITERKQSEEIIKKQLIELQSKNRELEQFNYISSHDLQEPLRTVLNYIQLLEEDYPELSDEIKAHHKIMQSSVTRMSTVVRSLLDFGRLGRNKKLVLTDCKKIIGEVIADLNTIVRDSGAVITLSEGHPVIYAYETEMRQLFQNLINNAIKFRKPGTVPHINISYRESEGYFEFAVADNGIGIQPKYFEKVFDIFQRLNKEGEFEGHGIGLANCKKIAEMHGGKIWVESVPGEGSTFKFTISNFRQ